MSIRNDTVIRVIASHGLGNQLFQFCFAHYLAENKGLVTFENNPIFSKNLNFMLRELNQVCQHLNFKTNLNISHTHPLGRIVYRLNVANALSKLILDDKTYTLVNERSIGSFSPDILKHKFHSDKQIYYGFWQHWKYVEPVKKTVADEIKKILSLKITSPINENVTGKKVVVHIRRGDYLTRDLDSVLGVISPESYLKMIDKLSKKYDNLNLVTVTDDSNLANLKFYKNNFGVILGPDACSPWEALKLMANADYVISANSTLSWWGALLSTTNGGTGFIPDKWHKNLNTKGAYDLPNFYKYHAEYL